MWQVCCLFHYVVWVVASLVWDPVALVVAFSEIPWNPDLTCSRNSDPNLLKCPESHIQISWNSDPNFMQIVFRTILQMHRLQIRLIRNSGKFVAAACFSILSLCFAGLLAMLQLRINPDWSIEACCSWVIQAWQLSIWNVSISHT